MASLSMLNVLPTPGAYPRKSLNTPPFFAGAASSNHCSGVLDIAFIVVETFAFVDVGYNRLVKPAVRSALGYVLAAVSVLVIILLGRSLAGVNPTTIALAFLLGVLGVS